MDFTFILHSLANGRPLVSHAACDDLKMSITYTFNSAMEPIVGSCMAIIKDSPQDGHKVHNIYVYLLDKRLSKVKVNITTLEYSNFQIL